jgi:hypothetical protein|tara:strand:+ start:603 stop:944 length:342 start_codon:yes stop_codon:yes gene_type:complete
MTNTKRKQRQIKSGVVYLIDTYAGVRVKIKATRKEICPFTKKDAWYGVLIDEEDAIALHKAGVPYSRINDDEAIIFNWQIVKSIRLPKQESRKKNAGTNRKPKLKRRKDKKSI